VIPAVISAVISAGGHLAAGLLAQQMGLPITLLAATNANDALHRLLATGELRAHGTVSQTASPSMDIQARDHPRSPEITRDHPRSPESAQSALEGHPGAAQRMAPRSRHTSPYL